MPSLFSKLAPSSSKRKNPYSNPHHPSHAPLPTKLPNQRSATQPPQLRPASPRDSHDFLAEARQLTNRDPVTGRPLPREAQTASESSRIAQARLNAAGASRGVQARPPVESSAYLNRASKIQPTSGKRYDIISYEERKMRDEQERIRKAMGGTEFYAPERRVEEFYADGVVWD